MPENKYLFVSDIHGYDEKLAEQLLAIATNEKTPKIVFFIGDIVGTTLLDGLQKKFYNVFNQMKTLQDASDEEIEKKVGAETNELNSYLHNISKEFYGISLVETAKRIALYEHFGHFTSNLPGQIKRELQKDMEKNAKALINIMAKFIQNGSMVAVIEGNWDARTPLDFYPVEKCQALPIEYRSFYFKNFLKSLNDKILYFDEVGTIETETEIFVLWPFDSTINIAQVPEFEDENTKK